MLDLSPIADEMLVRRVAAGDASALEMLYDRYVRQCFGLAVRILGNQTQAEDVVQEVFAKLWSQPGLYSPEKGKFVSWLLSLVHHRCVDELRKKASTEVALEDPASGNRLDLEADPEPDPSDQVWLMEQGRVVRQALSQLTPGQREVLELAYFGGLSQSQIAARLSQPLGTVKTRMRLGLQSLRALLEAHGLLAD